MFDCELILLDVNLGRENGIAVCRRFRELGYSGGIIMVSGLGESQVKARALDAGADDYVTKPATGDELRARLRSVLRRVQPAAAASRASGLRLGMVLATLNSASDRRMLRKLVAAAGVPVKRAELKAIVLENPEASDKALEKRIERLRDVVEPLGVRIETVAGIGYSCPTRFD
ncbi:MAG: response regulator transcription factor [Myxococcales bacterium]|nr:response regulator transcription factor [Myxococcales bacterium]